MNVGIGLISFFSKTINILLLTVKKYFSPGKKSIRCISLEDKLSIGDQTGKNNDQNYAFKEECMSSYC